MNNMRLNLGKSLSLRGVSLVLATTVMMTGLSGCGKKAECDIKGDHAHLYTNEQNFSRYINKEYLSYEGYERQEDYKVLSEDEKKLCKFEDKKDLLRIDENIDAIAAVQEQNHDYIEYRYAYTYLMPIPHHVRSGKTSYTYFTYIPVTHHSWTSNPEHSRLTGEQRRCHHVYQACNVVIDENGKYVVVPSDYVDDIFSLNGEYTYIKESFCKVIDAEYGYDLDYEDGVEDDPDLIDEDAVVEDNTVTQSYNTQEFYGTGAKLVKKLS